MTAAAVSLPSARMMKPATVLDRLKAYHEQTEPLVEFYRQRGKLVEVPDQGSIEATTAFLLKLLEA